MATVPTFHPSVQKTVLLVQRLLDLINDEQQHDCGGVFVPTDIHNLVTNFLRAHHECTNGIRSYIGIYTMQWEAGTCNYYKYKYHHKEFGVPPDIRILANDFLQAHQEFIDGINNFMHRKRWEKEELAMTKVIIETCPEVLEVPFEFKFVHDDDENKNSIGNRSNHHHCTMGLPLHYAALSNVNAADFIQLLTKVGLEHGVGGNGGRGGLLVGFSRTIPSPLLANTPLLLMLRHDDVKSIKALMHNKLLLKSDIQRYELVHGAARFGSIQLIKFLVNLDHSSLWRQYNYQIPLQFCIKGDTDDNISTARYLLKKSVQYYAAHETIGGLFSFNLRGKTILEEMIEKYGQEITWWDIVEESLPSYVKFPILHNVIKYVPDQISSAIRAFPDFVTLRDGQNRLPIHLALEAGLQWSDGLFYILDASRPYLKDKDPVQNVYPFMLAISKPSCDLKTINYLLRLHPEYVIPSRQVVET